jgi:hypothetical protein
MLLGIFLSFIFFTFLSFFIIIPVLIYRRVKQKQNLKKMNDEDFKESILTSGTKEKAIKRELLEWEKQILTNKFHDSKDRNFDLDLRSPVFIIQGKLRRTDVISDIHHEKEAWGVRDLVIRVENYPELLKEDLNEGEEVKVEYSPFTKHVWKIYKTEDI